MEDIPDITIADIAKETNISPKGVEWQIRQLKKHGKIRRHGPDKGGYWEVIDTKNK